MSYYEEAAAAKDPDIIKIYGFPMPSKFFGIPIEYVDVVIGVFGISGLGGKTLFGGKSLFGKDFEITLGWLLLGLGGLTFAARNKLLPNNTP